MIKWSRQINSFTRRKKRLVVALSFLFSVPLASISFAYADISQKESKIRTAVIFGLLRFASWPDGRHPVDKITLCEAGKSVTAKTIKDLRSIPKIGKYTIESKSVDTSMPIDDCHAVLIGKDSPQLDFGDNSVLVICDDCDPPSVSVSAINLKRKDNLIQFEINMDHIEQRNIKLSATVLELASKCSSSNPAIRGCDD